MLGLGLILHNFTLDVSCPPEMDVQEQGHQREGDPLVPRHTGFGLSTVQGTSTPMLMPCLTGGLHVG